MKKMTLVLGVVASVLVLASCANKGTADQNAAQAPAAAHGHDFKGEVK